MLISELSKMFFYRINFMSYFGERETLKIFIKFWIKESPSWKLGRFITAVSVIKRGVKKFVTRKHIFEIILIAPKNVKILMSYSLQQI